MLNVSGIPFQLDFTVLKLFIFVPIHMLSGSDET